MKARPREGSGFNGLLVLLAAFLAPVGLAAQGSGFSVGGGGAFELYSFSDDEQVGIERVGLFTAPFGARATVAEDVDIQVFGNYAFGFITPSGGGDEMTLNGLTDTDIQLDYRVGGDAVTFSGIFSLPTGTSTLDQEEVAVAAIVAADLLPFRISNWGSGGGYAFQVAGARRFGGFGAGLSVAYRLAGDFEPLAANEFTYEPGDEIRVRLALDTEIGTGGKGSIVAGYRSFSEDAREGSNVFEVGNRYNVTASYAFPAGSGAGVLYGGVIHRENGTALSAPFVDSPSQDLVLMGSQFQLSWGDTRVRPRVDGRLFRTDDGRGQGYVAGAGVSFEIPAGFTTWVPSVTGRIGNVEVAEGQESSFTGVEAGLSVRFGR